MLSIIEMWERQWKHHPGEKDEIKSFVRSFFPIKRASTFQKLLSNIRSGEMFDYVQCDSRTPDNLKENLEAFPMIFKNTLVIGYC